CVVAEAADGMAAPQDVAAAAHGPVPVVDCAPSPLVDGCALVLEPLNGGPAAARAAVDRRFFFQAEDGIRDFHVTGVQTCALPILPCGSNRAFAKQDDVAVPAVVLVRLQRRNGDQAAFALQHLEVEQANALAKALRSEERRVGNGG